MRIYFHDVAVNFQLSDTKQAQTVAEMGNRWPTIDVGRKRKGAAVPLSGGELTESPSNTMWPGPRSITVPSGILMHPVDWPQQT